MDQDIFEKITALRHDIHAHPELSNHETRTKRVLIEFLKKETGLEIVDRGLWFYARYRSGSDRKGIAFRAELDALPIEDRIDAPYVSQVPGVGHKCGHDGHMSALAGAACMVDRYGADRDVYFLFQHAEETGDGAPVCADLLREQPIAEIYGWHNRPGEPFGQIGLRDGTLYDASRGMTVHFHGVSSHAAYPELGHNPAFAIADMIRELDSVVKKPGYRGLTQATIIRIDVGENAFGTQAHEGSFSLTVRAEYQAELEAVQADLIALAESKAAEYGLTAEYSYCDDFPVTDSTPTCNENIRRACEKLGFPVYEVEKPYRGSEDFGHYTRIVPGAYFEVGTGEDRCQIHTVGFDIPDETMAVACDLFFTLSQ